MACTRTCGTHAKPRQPVRLDRPVLWIVNARGWVQFGQSIDNHPPRVCLISEARVVGASAPSRFVVGYRAVFVVRGLLRVCRLWPRLAPAIGPSGSTAGRIQVDTNGLFTFQGTELRLNCRGLEIDLRGSARGRRRQDMGRTYLHTRTNVEGQSKEDTQLDRIQAIFFFVESCL